MKKAIAGVLILGATATGGTLAADRAIDPYTDKSTHYELAIKSDIPQGERVEIHKDKAQMDLIGWNDEYKISIIPQIPTTQLGAKDKPFVVEANRPLLSKRMEYKSGDVTAFIEPKEGTENEFDIDFTLDAKPESNVFEYKIEGADQLDFFYQPPLTQEEIDEGAERPERVEGSYAVYHRTKANYCTNCGTANYATGKAFHIYRPKAIDANGGEVWAELSYSEGVLAVTVPQEWLEKAAYPVVVDPTFGYTSIGGTTSSLAEDTIRVNSPWTAPENGTVEKLTVYLNQTGTSDVNFRPVTYLNSSDALHTYGGEIVITANTAAWNDADLTDTSITASTNYDLGVWINIVTGGGVFVMHYDAGTHELRRDDIAYHATNPPPDPFVEVSAIASRDYSIYATYTASGGGSPTPITPKVQIQAPITINAPTILQ